MKTINRQHIALQQMVNSVSQKMEPQHF